MTPSQLRALAAFRRGIADLASSLSVIKPREVETKELGKIYPETKTTTDGFDGALTSGERCAALEIAAVLKLYSLPEGKK
jgi:hypothetical protein